MDEKSNLVVDTSWIQGGAFIKLRLYSFLLTFLSTFPIPVLAEDAQVSSLYDLSIENLLDAKIVSASKREEKLFDAPMAASVITGDQILRSGATTIPEALRLIPGVIVRQQTSGNYDVHIRGFDNVPPNYIVRFSANNLTLVMIDNRVVYNHYFGGTFWEALPIGLTDIDRIEVVRGAASALYGPNAVTGVVHILTKDPHETQEKMSAYVEGGSDSHGQLEASYGFQVNEEWKGRLSANTQLRDRHSSTYYSWADGAYVNTPEDIVATNPPGPLTMSEEKYPDPEQAGERQGFNLNLSGKYESGLEADLSLGMQDSQVQKVYDDNAATPLTTVKNESYYFNYGARWNNWSARLGHEDGSSDSLGYLFGFDFSNTSLSFEGDFELDKIRLQPIAQYRKQKYEGENVSGEDAIDISSVGLRSEYDLDDWRLIAAFRGDHYDFSSKTEGSYFVGASHQTSDSFIYRFSYARSHQEPFMSYTYEEIFFPITPTYGIRARGNENLELVTVHNLELGMRWDVNKQTSVDLELFHNKIEDYQVTFKNGVSYFVDTVFVEEVQYQNVPLVADQQGLTIDTIYSREDFTASLFITIQETDLEDAPAFNAFFEQVSLNDGEHLNTPEWYGGFDLNYSPRNDLTWNINTYYFDDHQQVNTYTFPASGEVKAKWLINTKVSYALLNNLDCFFNIRNVMDDDDIEFAFTDEAGAVYLLGMRWTDF